MSWNEPGRPNDQWGGKQSEEFDALINKVKEMFGQNKSSGDSENSSNGGGGAPLKLPKKAIGSIFLVLFIIWASTGLYQIENAERGVVIRFGKFVEETSEGLNWHLPYPIERVEVVNVQAVRSAEIGFRSNNTKVLSEALMLTEDENIVDVELSIQYQILSAPDFLFNVRDPENTLRQVTESALREVVGRSPMDDVLTEGRERVVADVKVLLQNTLNEYKTGLQVYTVNMRNASAPQQVQAAFNDVVKAREDKERFINEAEAYTNQILPQARGEAARLTEEALGYKDRVIAEAKGQTDRFLSISEEFKKAPEVTKERLYLQSIESIFERTSKVIVDVEGGNNILYLPLDKIVNHGRTENNNVTQNFGNKQQGGLTDPNDRVNQLRGNLRSRN